MPSYDVYCAICGTPALFRPFYDHYRAEDLSSEISPGPEEMKWLGDTRILGENHHASTTDKVYISGPATYAKSGIFKVEPGDDLNFPTADQVKSQDGLARIRVYDFERSIDFAIPFHEPCYQLLKKALVYWRLQREEDNIDKGLLYTTFMKFADGSLEGRASLYRLDYGCDANQFIRWTPYRDDEWLFWNPMISTGPERYFEEELPLLDEERKELKASNKALLQNIAVEIGFDNDPFNQLPLELISMIMVHLDLEDLGAFRVASLAAADQELDRAFWKQKLRHDMPWMFELFDILDQMREQDSRDIDWVQVHRDLSRICDPDPENQYMYFVLGNRHRIWRSCEDIAKAFKQLRNDSWSHKQNTQGSILENAVTTLMQPLACPLPSDLDTVTLPFVEEISDLHQDPPRLSLFWSEDGTLSGFGSEGNNKKGGNPKRTIGHMTRFDRRDDVQIQYGDWIVGFVLNFDDEGYDDYWNMGKLDKKIIGVNLLFLSGASLQLGDSTRTLKIFHAKDDLLLLGIMAKITKKGQIASLSLLQVPTSTLDSYAEELGRQQSKLPYAQSSIGSKMWKNGLPPPEIRPGTGHIVPFIPSVQLPTDAVPMESLVFGKDETELAAITEIIGDIDLQGIEIRYSDRPPKSIGPNRHAASNSQSMKIDGQGGERIVSLDGVFKTKWFNAVRFVTNRGRSFVLGDSRAEMQQKLYPPGEGMVLRGVYGVWTELVEGKFTLEVVGGLFSDASPQFPSLDVLVPEALDGEDSEDD